MRNFLFISFVCISLFIFTFYGEQAAAGNITITGVSGASGYEGLDGSPIVYGGMAGNVSGSTFTAAVGSECETPVTGSTCSSCLSSGLTICNNKSIYPDLSLTISFVSDDTDGTAVMTLDNGTTQIATGSATTKGTETTIKATWREICTALGATVTSTDCVAVSGNGFTANIKVGVSTDGQLTSASAAAKLINIRVQYTIDAAATDCSNAVSGDGLCYFEVKPGDAKVHIMRVIGPSGFPNGPNVPYKHVRLFHSTTSFAAITSASPYQDLGIEATDATNFTLSPKRVTGLTNKTTYFFRAATVDAAGNVGYYTQTAEDEYCLISGSSSQDTGNLLCHRATPDEVYGVLQEKVNCFIATAAYGSPFAARVNTFRTFRDRYLIPNKIGLEFVRFYIRHAPKAAALIAQSDALREISRILLWPAWVFAASSLWLGPIPALLLLLTLLALPTLAWRHRARLATLRKARPFSQKHPHASFIFWMSLTLGLGSHPIVSHAQNAGVPSDPPAIEAAQAEEEFDLEAEEEKPAAPAKPEDEIAELQNEVPPKAEPPYPTSDEPGFESKRETEVGLSNESTAPTLMTTPVFEERPMAIGSQGEYFYPVSESTLDSSMSLRMGIFGPPDITNPKNLATFKEIYGEDQIPALIVDYEWQALKGFGRAGIRVGSGLFVRPGNGRFVASSAGVKNPIVAEEKFIFLMFPNMATLIYRFQGSDKQAFVPYIEGGGGYFTFVELRDDDIGTKFGGTPVAAAAGGINFLLDGLDKNAVRQLDKEYGINHVWLTLEYRQIIGLNQSFDVSSSLINAGVMMEF